ncbi:MAG: BlaI/MecI/CopY family transcriptional regulator [Verrucomicrobiales bacterium]|nr:BlaI/MecI/CopY family transcriptional regulator [Verrucomicrobiales bacterium]
MLKRKNHERPQRLSAGDMSLMQMLWQKGPVSLSEAHRAMCELQGDVGYTTVQTRLDRLVAKKAVRKSTDRPTRYEAVLKPEEVSRPMMSLLLERVSGAVPLVAHLVNDPSVSAEDLKEMKRLIQDAEKNRARR